VKVHKIEDPSYVEEWGQVLGETAKIDRKSTMFSAEDAREEKNSQKNIELLLQNALS